MTKKFIPLDRQFSLVPSGRNDLDISEYVDILSGSKSVGWTEIESQFRTVILAEAGAGKSVEMSERAREAEKNGRAAFFIRIEEIDQNFQNSFEIGEQEDFDRWLTGNHEAWFYLDSVDEARLKDPISFKLAVRRFAKKIKHCYQRAHIILSSRPYAWQPVSDPAFMDEVLYLPMPKDIETEEKKTSQEESALRVYQMKPLDQPRVRIYADAHGVPAFDQLWHEIERLNLHDLAERPFDLDSLFSKWKKDQLLGGRLLLLQNIIKERLDEIDPDRTRMQPLAQNKALEGARMLAAAVILTGEQGIRVPDSKPSPIGIAAEDLLDWNPNDMRALLERAIFNDVIFDSVRFRHRETRELLAAEWFRDILHSGCSRNQIESLIFREQYGEEIITPRLRPILPWLILFDEQVRNRIMTTYPEIALEGGDPAELPLTTRKKILTDIARRFASKGNHRNTINNSAVARISQQDLAADVVMLIRQYACNDEAMEFLAQIVWQGRLVTCIDDFIQIIPNSQLRDDVKLLMTRAVMICGTDEQKCMLWSLLINTLTEIPHELVTIILRHSLANQKTVIMLMNSLEKITPHEDFTPSEIVHAIHDLIDNLPIDGTYSENEVFYEMISGFKKILSNAPYIERGECHVSEKFVWLLGPATHAVERLVLAQHSSTMKPDAISILLKAPVVRYWRKNIVGDYRDKLSELVPKWPELNDHLFWENIRFTRIALLEKNGDPLITVWPAMWAGHFWSYDKDSFTKVLHFIENRILEDDKLVALDLAYRIYKEAGQPIELIDQLSSVVSGHSKLAQFLSNLQNPTLSLSDLQWKMEEERYMREQAKNKSDYDKNRSAWIERLRKNPEIVSNPCGLKKAVFTNDQSLLLGELINKGLHIERICATNWQDLAVEFGDDVAKAFRSAAVGRWRIYNPLLHSEGAESVSTTYSQIFAMTGLQIESKEVANFPQYLTKEEVEHALRYITCELSGFPSWLEKMHSTFPDQVNIAIQKELEWELTNSTKDQTFDKTLHAIAYRSPWLHPHLVHYLVTFLNSHDIFNHDILRHILQILKSGDTPIDILAEVAQYWAINTQVIENKPFWYALWVDTRPACGVPNIETWLNSLNECLRSEYAQRFFVSLIGNKYDHHTGLKIGNYLTPRYLKALYVLSNRYIQSKDDIKRIGAFSPELRDHAQDARNRLFSMLAEIPGKETYTMLKELIRDHPDPDARVWMAKEAYRRAEEDGNIEPWTLDQVRDFTTNQTRSPKTHRELFDVGVAKLIDLKEFLERGSYSTYRNWQRAEDEPEMRNLVTHWLSSNSGNRFTCAQENELANKQRTDILLQNHSVTSPVPIELKLLDKDWSGPDLCERLRNQLAGDYLREVTSGCGVMLLIWRGKSDKKHWIINDRSVTLAELSEALSLYWNSISPSFSNVSALKIIVIDLTIRDTKSTI